MTQRAIERGEFYETVIGAPPEGWTLGHVTLTFKTAPTRKAIEAWRRGAFAVHEVIWPDKGGRLTHAPTGLQIWTFDTMDAAAECGELIETLTDWISISEMIPMGSDLYPKVRAIVDEVRGVADGEREPSR